MPEPEPQTPTPENPPTPTPEEKSFSQKDVDKIAGNRAKDAAKSAEKTAYERLLTELGAESLDDLKEGYKGFKIVQEETQTEADKAKAEAERIKGERDEARKATEEALKLADDRLIQADLKGALRDGGIQAEYLPLALRLADTSTVEITDGEVKGVSDVVEAVKQASPVWFGAEHERLPRTPDGKDSKRDIASEISKRRRDKLPAHLRPNS